MLGSTVVRAQSSLEANTDTGEAPEVWVSSTARCPDTSAVERELVRRVRVVGEPAERAWRMTIESAAHGVSVDLSHADRSGLRRTVDGSDCDAIRRAIGYIVERHFLSLDLPLLSDPDRADTSLEEESPDPATAEVDPSERATEDGSRSEVPAPIPERLEETGQDLVEEDAATNLAWWFQVGVGGGLFVDPLDGGAMLRAGLRVELDHWVVRLHLETSTPTYERGNGERIWIVANEAAAALGYRIDFSDAVSLTPSVGAGWVPLVVRAVDVPGAETKLRSFAGLVAEVTPAIRFGDLRIGVDLGVSVPLGRETYRVEPSGEVGPNHRVLIRAIAGIQVLLSP